MTTDADARAALQQLRSTTDSYLTARQMMLHLRAERDRAVHAACLAGAKQQDIGDIIGTNREQVRLIRDAVAAGNAGQEPRRRPRRRTPEPTP